MKNKDIIKVYPVIIHKDNDEVPYSVSIPAINGETQGDSIENAMDMAKDYIGTWSLVNDNLPKSEYHLPKTDDIVTLVKVNITKYRQEHPEHQKGVKKTIRELRQERGLTQQQLADELFVDSKTINNWENYRTRPMGVKQRLLANYFNVDVKDIKFDR